VASVRLRFLGSGDAFASGGRFHTCFLLEGGPQPLLIDCGPTALVALKREHIDPASIGTVALSHLHGDHFGGLPWLVLDGQFTGRTLPLLVAGPPGTETRFRQAFEALYPGADAVERPFEMRIVELPERAGSELGPAVVTPFEVAHSSGAPSYALRVEYGGKVIAYSGDTEWTDVLLDVSRGADLFICECNFFDRRVPGHLDYRTLAGQLPRFECARFVITHMSEEMLSRVGEVAVETATDGLVIEP
jgi:ribonuclease BN (tRNA processing enzyme)